MDTTDAMNGSWEPLWDEVDWTAASNLPPENALQGRVLSEHELRVQRSLQRLNVPDWYKNSQKPADGFLLRRSERRWPGLGTKTTSLSSLGSAPSTGLRSPTARLGASPSPPPNVFSRWSSTRIHSADATPSISPCGSARSSFNHRQPYLGWRSQERLTSPRTPAERLAAGLLPAVRAKQQQQQQQHQDEVDRLQAQSQASPNLSEVRTSIKEVTSAIVHYVSGHGAGANDLANSPRGSTNRLCWLESSFVGTRPVESPETPGELRSVTPQQDLYLDLHKQQHRNGGGGGGGADGVPETGGGVIGDVALSVAPRPSPGSTTMEDVLDSLLGLPPPSRSPSPGPTGVSVASSASAPSGATSGTAPTSSTVTAGRTATAAAGTAGSAGFARRSCGDLRLESAESANDWSTRASTAAAVAAQQRRRSEGSAAPTPDQEPVVQCQRPDCNASAPAFTARREFKTCHNCALTYCSRSCRRAHWERHRTHCAHSRAGALCRRVVGAVRSDGRRESALARRSYLAVGRGAVRLDFSGPEQAEHFCNGNPIEPRYVRAADLEVTETGASLHAQLLRLCRTYNPDARYVLLVAVSVVSEVPTSGAVRWERQVVTRCARLRLHPTLLATPTLVLADSLDLESVTPPPPISRDSDNPETLILTSLPGPHGARARQLSFCNIQRELRQRGVSLRRQFPDVYAKLAAYVDGTSERFTPVTVYPVDAASGKSFMCIIMPDAEPQRLELLPKDGARVRTVDVLSEPLQDPEEPP